MYDAAVQAGAPEHIIACLSRPNIAATTELMGHRDVALILATGGAAMVRAAYSAGKPAYGVGPGNVPATEAQMLGVLSQIDLILVVVNKERPPATTVRMDNFRVSSIPEARTVVLVAIGLGAVLILRVVRGARAVGKGQ